VPSKRKYNIAMPPQGFLVMGVSGSGKSTFGKALAQKLEWDFFDADDFHPPENIAKMQAGLPLDDSDRTPWLSALSNLLSFTLTTGRHPVLACSALKESYRAKLLDGKPGIKLVYLRGSYDLIWSRMSNRAGHYMKPAMLQSQFDILEEPEHALVLDVSMSVGEMLEIALRDMKAPQDQGRFARRQSGDLV
jgi:gluconokinase